MLKRSLCIASQSFLVVGLLSQSAHATVTLNDGGVTTLTVQARDTNFSFDNQTENLFPDSLPVNASHLATIGNSNSQAEYDLNQDRFQIMSFGARAGVLDSRANVQPVFYFSVAVDTPYAISGNLTTVDPSAKFAGLTTTLTDIDTLAVLFHSNQSSFGVVNEVFELGGIGGNVDNELTGSATGILSAGHRYSLFYGTSIYAANTGSGASFTGTFEIAFVPEPSSVALLGMCGLAMLGRVVRPFRRENPSLKRREGSCR